jgi:hypothetical protein
MLTSHALVTVFAWRFARNTKAVAANERSQQLTATRSRAA